MTKKINEKNSDLRLILLKQLPKGVNFDPPKNLFKRSEQIAAKNLKEDKTLKKKEVQLKILICIICFIGIVMFVSYLSSYNPRQKKSHFKSHNINSITKTKNFKITEDQIEETASNGYSNPYFSNQPAKVGDSVSYKNQDSGNGGSLKSNQRVLNTPLYSANDGFGYDSKTSIRAPKLPITKNSYIRAYLENNISSQNSDMPFTAISYTELTPNGKLKIPKGSRFDLKVSRVSENHRVEMTSNFVVFPNGKEYSIRAIIIGDDNNLGVKSQTDYKLAKKGTGIVASSLLNAFSNSVSIAGSSSFGTNFAGEMAGNTSDSLDSALNYYGRNQGLSEFIPMNTRFKIVFH